MEKILSHSEKFLFDEEEEEFEEERPKKKIKRNSKETRCMLTEDEE